MSDHKFFDDLDKLSDIFFFYKFSNKSWTCQPEVYFNHFFSISTVGRSDGWKVQKTISDSKRTWNRILNPRVEETGQCSKNNPEIFQSLRTVSHRYHHSVHDGMGAQVNFSSPKIFFTKFW